MLATSPRREALSEVLLISATMLFLELALIRWLPANIYSLAFFSNLVLMATFYGFGLGNLLGRLSTPLMKIWPFYLVLLIAVVLLLREADILIPAESSEWIWSRYQDDQISRGRLQIPLEAVLIALFFLVAFLFVPLGQRLAHVMVKVESLSFYDFDLLGSLAGIALFSLASATGAPPYLWFLGVALLASLILRRLAGRLWLLFTLPLLVVAALTWHFGRGETWSPYYSIMTKPNGANLQVFVNRLYHQEAIDLEHSEVPGYLVPYEFFEGGDVLVIGAGTGNDVSIALSHGATSVDAVEIDPVIQKLGARHPLRPYADPRVTAIVQDARTYLHTTQKRYDLVVFGTLDSHALLSSVSTVRLDNYVYTQEALRAARRCLREKGILAMLYSVPSEAGEPWMWIEERLTGMVASVFGEGKVLRFFSNSAYLNLVVVARTDGQWGEEWGQRVVPIPGEDILLPSDDWPFLYLRGRAIPGYNLRVIAAVLLIGSLPIFASLPQGKRRPHWNFLLLGVGFLLLETSAITRLSLLFGSTWIVNSVVFFSILLMVLLANFVVQRGKTFRPHLIYLGISLSLLLSYTFDLENLLYSSFALKVATALLLVGVPVFFAGLAFSQLFKREKAVQYAFGSNLLGAFLGGFLEYAGMMIGLGDLLLVALVVYLGSYRMTLGQLRQAV